MSGIETARLRIVPFSAEHLNPRYVAWLNDAEVMRYSEQRHSIHTLASCHSYWRSFEGTPNSFWAIVARDGALGHIGNMSVYVDPHNEVADIGILIGERSAWGKGLGSEAWIAMCDHLFRVEGMRKITAGTVSANDAMLGVMRHAGMVDDGRRPRHHLIDGAEVDLVHGALFRHDWRGIEGATGHADRGRAR